MRIPQKQGIKGSLKWIQILVNQRPDLLGAAISRHIAGGLPDDILWLSPLEEDEYSEYRDASFLERLDLTPQMVPLRSFWPRRGPQWDALGKCSGQGSCFLVEAKANIPEIASCCSATSESSLQQIDESLKATCSYLDSTGKDDTWRTRYYQYANRLAHLYFLRELNSIDAYLVFVYFLHDRTHIPTRREEWAEALARQEKEMGLNRHKLKQFVVNLFLDVRDLSSQIAAHPRNRERG